MGGNRGRWSDYRDRRKGKVIAEKLKQNQQKDKKKKRVSWQESRAEHKIFFFLLFPVTLPVCRGVGAGKEDPILHSLQTNLSTNVVDGRLGKGGTASDLSILGAPFNKPETLDLFFFDWSKFLRNLLL